jgi:hybrid cluster-associated redox disulfide protein
VKITSDTRVEDVLAEYPVLTKVFIEFGLPCLVCGEAYWGTVADLAHGHDIDVKALLKTLNEKKQKTYEKI